MVRTAFQSAHYGVNVAPAATTAAQPAQQQQHATQNHHQELERPERGRGRIPAAQTAAQGSGGRQARERATSSSAGTRMRSLSAATPNAPWRWSCEPCRTRKIKCDGVRPVCGNCIRRSIKRCVFLGTKSKVDTALAEKNIAEIEEVYRLRFARFCAATGVGGVGGGGDDAAAAVSHTWTDRDGVGGDASTPSCSASEHPPAGPFQPMSMDAVLTEMMLEADQADQADQADSTAPAALPDISNGSHHHLLHGRSHSAQVAPLQPSLQQDRRTKTGHPLIPRPLPLNLQKPADSLYSHGSPRPPCETGYSGPQSSHVTVDNVPDPLFLAAWPSISSALHMVSPQKVATPLSSEIVPFLDCRGWDYGMDNDLPLPPTPQEREVKRPGAPEDEERMLVDNFFDHYYCVVPHMHRRTYLENLENTSPFLRMAVCATGATIPSSQSYRKIAPWYYQQARKFSVETLDSPTLEAVKGFLVLGWASLCMKMEASLWLFVGMASRMAVYLRLNEDEFDLAPGESWVEKETRIRTWWACYMLDRFAAIFSHMPPLLQRDYPEKSPLCREDIWTSWQEPSALVNSYVHSRKPEDNYRTYSIQLWELFTIVRIEIRKFERLKEQKSTPTEREAVRSILESLDVTAELEEWLRQVPSKYWVRLDEDYIHRLVNSQSGSSAIWRELSTMYLVYHGLICCSTRRATLWLLQQACGNNASGGDPSGESNSGGGSSGGGGDAAELGQRKSKGSLIILPGLSHILSRAESTQLLQTAALKALRSAESICTLISLLLRASASLDEFPPASLFVVFEGAITIFLMEMAIPFLPVDFQRGSFSTDAALRHMAAAASFFRGVATRWGPAISLAVLVDRLRTLVLVRKTQRERGRWTRTATERAAKVIVEEGSGGGDGRGGGGGDRKDAASPSSKRSQSPPSHTRAAAVAAVGATPPNNATVGGGGGLSDFEIPPHLLQRDATSRKILHKVCASPFATVEETLQAMTELARRGGIVDLLVF
ncbi:fungal-specific transcription factor domain-containing protein [Zopfochytrium polystomum]|nr:fungal-specific transcription factor domain-containing protein [Zopfochytrium polystomum]